MSQNLLISPRFDALIDSRVDTDNPFRLGLFGGTFDPVHVGHMSIAERAFEQFDLDGVVFIPTGYPVRKSKTGFSAAEDRCTMLKMAVAGNEHFDISHIEVDREGATYTIDTLRTLQTRYGDKVKLFFITGEDSTRDLSTWKDAPEIAQLVEVLSAPRTIPKADESTIVHNVSSFIVHTIQTPLIDIASSELREWVRLGHSLRYLVPEVVCDYIRQQGLYQR